MSIREFKRAGIIFENSASHLGLRCMRQLDSEIMNFLNQVDEADHDPLLACYVANTACAIVVIMTTLIFIIVSCSHAFLLVVLKTCVLPRTSGS